MSVTARAQAVMLAPRKGLSLLQRELAGTLDVLCSLGLCWLVLLGAPTNINSFVLFCFLIQSG